MTTNPFTTYAIRNPNLLIGRGELLKLLTTEVCSGPVMLHGGRRTGKSSLLRCMATERPGETSNIKWWYWDAQSILTGGLDEACKRHGAENGLEAEIKKAAVDGKRLVLLFDEFDCLFTAGDSAPPFTPQDFQLLRVLLSEYDQNFGMIAAVSRRITDIEMKGSNLTNLFYPIDMKSLELQEAKHFYEQYLKQAGAGDLWDEKQEFFAKALEYSAMHPWLLQLAGKIVCSANTVSDYYEKLQALEDNVTRTVSYAIETLDESEAVWFCLYCRKIPGVTLRNYTEYETLGLTTKGVIPQAISLAALNWLNGLDKKNQINPDSRNWEQIVSRLTGKHLEEAMQNDRAALVEAIRYCYLDISSDGTLMSRSKSFCGNGEQVNGN